MRVIKTEIDGVLILEPRVFEDQRGYFFESFNQMDFEEHVGPVDFVQDNESKSSYGVVRGLHFQKGEHCQAKLVRVVKGRVLDVAVDIRPGSPTFGKHVAVELTEENHLQFFLPRGMDSVSCLRRPYSSTSATISIVLHLRGLSLGMIQTLGLTGEYPPTR